MAPRSVGSGVFTLTSATPIAVAYKVSVARASDGLGLASNLAAEVYGRLSIWRI